MVVKAFIHIPSMSPFLLAAPLVCFDVKCKQHHTTALNPLSKDTRNSIVDGARK